MSSKKYYLFGVSLLVLVVIMQHLLYDRTFTPSLCPSLKTSTSVSVRQAEYLLRRYPDVEDTVFIFSVVIISRMFKPKSWDQVTINGWERRAHGRNYTCCYVYTDANGGKHVTRRKWTTKHHLFWGLEADLLSVQIKCDLDPLKVKGSRLYPSEIGLSLSGSCDGNIAYQQPVYVDYQKISQGFALCGKIIYGKKDVRQLIEWIEFHKYFGADHILIYAYYDLNRKALEVLEYYESSGRIEVVYMAAVAKIDKFPRHFSVRPDLIMNHDEHVAEFDAQTRLPGYKYFVLIDTDEFISPVYPSIKTYTQLMEYQLNKKRNAASFKLLTEIYMTSWGETHPTEDMGITREVANESVAVLKHYRACRDEWLIPQPEHDNQTQCDTFQRVPDDYMLDVAARIRDRVNDTTKHLRIP